RMEARAETAVTGESPLAGGSPTNRGSRWFSKNTNTPTPTWGGSGGGGALGGRGSGPAGPPAPPRGPARGGAAPTPARAAARAAARKAAAYSIKPARRSRSAAAHSPRTRPTAVWAVTAGRALLEWAAQAAPAVASRHPPAARPRAAPAATADNPAGPREAGSFIWGPPPRAGVQSPF